MRIFIVLSMENLTMSLTIEKNKRLLDETKQAFVFLYGIKLAIVKGGVKSALSQ